jgi:hypothetical protein
VTLAFQHTVSPAPRWPDPPYPQQLHLDLRADDPDAAARSQSGWGRSACPTGPRDGSGGPEWPPFLPPRVGGLLPACASRNARSERACDGVAPAPNNIDAAEGARSSFDSRNSRRGPDGPVEGGVAPSGPTGVAAAGLPPAERTFRLGRTGRTDSWIHGSSCASDPMRTLWPGRRLADSLVSRPSEARRRRTPASARGRTRRHR